MVTFLFIPQTAIKPALHIFLYSKKNSSRFTNNWDLWQFTRNLLRKMEKQDCKNRVRKDLYYTISFMAPLRSAGREEKNDDWAEKKPKLCISITMFIILFGNALNSLHLLTSFRLGVFEIRFDWTARSLSMCRMLISCFGFNWIFQRHHL